MVLLNSEQSALGAAAPDFSLPATDGETYSLDSFAGAKAYVIMFICNHCPYVQAIEDRLVELAREYIPQGVAFVGIMPNDVARYPADAPDKMRERAQQKGYPFPYLYDESQAVARAYDAVCTPDLYVYDADRQLAYHGRLDDNWKQPEQVTRRELKAAVDALLADESPAAEQMPCMGCSIKWKS